MAAAMHTASLEAELTKYVDLLKPLRQANIPTVGMLSTNFGVKGAQPMSSLPKCFATLLAAWNEYDPLKLRELVEASLTKDVAFTDPNYQIVGIEAFIDQIHEFRASESGQVKLMPTSGVVNGH